MPLKNYGILKGTPIDKKPGTGASPHYHVLIDDSNFLHRISINVKSKVSPSELLYYIDDDFSHPILQSLPDFEQGFTAINRRKSALDFIRANLFETQKMVPLTHDVPGPDNDLNEKIGFYIRRAIQHKATIYAFGERWGPEPDTRDKYFTFKPGSGIHDIHMNQGNVEKWKKADGVWQDGGLIIHYPAINKYVGIFLAFQSQCFQTEDLTGHCLTGNITEPDPDTKTGKAKYEGSVFIVAALVNSKNIGNKEQEKVILMNISDQTIDLSGWSIADTKKEKEILDGTIEPNDVRTIDLSGKKARLPNKGGIISLMDKSGIKIHGVSYTKRQAQKEGWLIRFL
jgi:uncharacterized protein YukJ